MNGEATVELKVGYVVKLKSVDVKPRMTISEIVNKTATCQWFVESELREGRFNVETLEKLP